MEPMHNGGHKRDTCHDTANACRRRRGHCNNTCARRDSPPSISNSSDCGPAQPLPSSSLLALTPPPQHQHPCIHTLDFWKMTYILNIDIIIRGLITVITIAVGPNPSIEVFASELISDASALYCCPSRGALVIDRRTIFLHPGNV